MPALHDAILDKGKYLRTHVVAIQWKKNTVVIVGGCSHRTLPFVEFGYILAQLSLAWRLSLYIGYLYAVDAENWRVWSVTDMILDFGFGKLI